MNRVILLLAFAVISCSVIARAESESLNQKFGPNWSCSMMSAGPLYRICLNCENNNREFIQLSDETGKCGNPIGRNSAKMKRLMDEMQQIESRQRELKSTLDAKEIARREEAFRQEEQRATERETQAYYDAQRRAQKAQEEAESKRRVIFVLKNSSSLELQAVFHSRNRNVVWPGKGNGYVIHAHDTQELRLRCTPGERICYGATVAGRSDHYWGIGPYGDKGCGDCCVTCGSGTARYTLTYTAPSPRQEVARERPGETASSGVNADHVLGIAAVVTGFALGVSAGGGGGGGGSSYYRPAPAYRSGGHPGYRESGVSGGR